MKETRFLVLLFAALFVFAVVPAAFANPLNACGTVSLPGSYQLSTNVSSSGTCFTIAASDVVLDCQGHTITYGTGGTGHGIAASSVSGITIKNCKIQKTNPSGSSPFGINMSDVSNSSILNNDISTKGENVAVGINLSGSSNAISSNKISTNGAGCCNFGINFNGSSNTVSSNTISTNGEGSSHFGIKMEPTGTSSAVSNNISSNTITTGGAVCCNTGVVVTASGSSSTSSSTVSSNMITTGGTGGGNHGIDVAPSGTSSVSSNDIFDNRVFTSGGATGNLAIRVISSSFNTVSNNLFHATNSASHVVADSSPNTWNTALTAGTNIVGGPFLGGNAWAGTGGFSVNCVDADSDGICDLPFNISTNNVDALPLAVGATELFLLGPAKVWVGLKNSDAVGLRLDLKAEVYVNTSKVGEGQLNDVASGSSGFNNALLDTIPLTLFTPVEVFPGDALRFTLLVRRTCFGAGHNSGTARLWFNDSQANSRFGATIGDTASDLFLLDGFVLDTTPGPGPKKAIDVSVDNKAACPDRPFKPFGTWSMTLP